MKFMKFDIAVPIGVNYINKISDYKTISLQINSQG